MRNYPDGARGVLFIHFYSSKFNICKDQIVHIIDNTFKFYGHTHKQNVHTSITKNILSDTVMKAKCHSSMTGAGPCRPDGHGYDSALWSTWKIRWTSPVRLSNLDSKKSHGRWRLETWYWLHYQSIADWSITLCVLAPAIHTVKGHEWDMQFAFLIVNNISHIVFQDVSEQASQSSNIRWYKPYNTSALELFDISFPTKISPTLIETQQSLPGNSTMPATNSTNPLHNPTILARI